MKRKKTTSKRKLLIAECERLGAEGNWPEAVAKWREFVSMEPDNASALFNLGICIQKVSRSPQERFESAEFFERIVTNSITPMDMKANAMNQLGLLMKTVGQEEKAATAFAFALSLDPSHGAAKINLADSYREMGSFDKAEEGYKLILDQSPDNADAHMCSGMLALLLGDYKRGWEEYRWRFKSKNFTTKPFATDRPLLEKGDPVDGKTITLTEEQGFGDSFNFIRYANEFTKRGARVLLRCQHSLRRVMGGVFGLYAAEPLMVDGLFVYDYHLPLLDCPWLFETEETNVPEAHCIRPMPDWPVWTLPNVNLLRPRIGLVWAGSPTHGGDKARSIAPEMLQPIIDANPQCDFYSLQAGPRAHEVARLARITDLAPQIENWTTSAQMLMCMDLLISVDTAMVHLAGCVGTKAWILLPSSPDWRWGLNSETTMWYPKARLFRQQKEGQWGQAIARVADELQKL